MSEAPEFKTGDRVRHVEHSEYGHGTVLEVTEEWTSRFRSAGVPATILVDWDRPARLARHAAGLIRKLTVFDRLALLGESA